MTQVVKSWPAPILLVQQVQLALMIAIWLFQKADHCWKFATWNPSSSGLILVHNLSNAKFNSLSFTWMCREKYNLKFFQSFSIIDVVSLHGEYSAAKVEHPFNFPNSCRLHRAGNVSTVGLYNKCTGIRKNECANHGWVPVKVKITEEAGGTQFDNICWAHCTPEGIHRWVTQSLAREL